MGQAHGTEDFRPVRCTNIGLTISLKRCDASGYKEVREIKLKYCLKDNNMIYPFLLHKYFYIII